MKDAYGKLQHFCHGLDLDIRVVDMRWGVTDDATNDHITEKLCLAEIENCKRVSLGPYFVVGQLRRFPVNSICFFFLTYLLFCAWRIFSDVHYVIIFKGW